MGIGVGGIVPTDNPKRGPFRMVSDSLWTHPDLEFFDVSLWCALTLHARGRDRCTPTDASLAGMLKVSVPTVQRGLRRLEGASFITRETVADDRVIVLHPEGDGRAAIFELRVMNAG
jgi:hypothetical protein